MTAKTSVKSSVRTTAKAGAAAQCWSACLAGVQPWTRPQQPRTGGETRQAVCAGKVMPRFFIFLKNA